MKKMAIAFLILAQITAQADGGQIHHHHRRPEFAELFFQMRENGFFLPPLPDDGDENDPFAGFDFPSPKMAPEHFIQLPNGKPYALDSEFWQAAAKMNASGVLATCMSHDHAHGSGLLGRIQCFVAEWTDGDEVRAKIADLKELWIRYGWIAAGVVGILEPIDHTFNPFPNPNVCAAIQAIGVFCSSQLQDVLNAVKSRYPLNRNPISRTFTSLEILKSRYQFWRAIRKGVFFNQSPVVTTRKLYNKHFAEDRPAEDLLLPTPFWSALLAKEPSDSKHPRSIRTVVHACGHDHAQNRFLCEPVADEQIQPAAALAMPDTTSPIHIEPFYSPLFDRDPEDKDRLARFYSAQEQIAYLELHLRLAKEAVFTTTSKHQRISGELRSSIAYMGKNLDRYASILRQMALSQTTTNNLQARQELIQYFIGQFLSYQIELDRYLRDVNNGYQPLNSPLLQMPQEIAKQIAYYQKKGELTDTATDKITACKEFLR